MQRHSGEGLKPGKMPDIGNNIINFINQYIHIDVLRKWGGIIIAVLIVVFLIYHLKTVKAFLYYGDDDQE